MYCLKKRYRWIFPEKLVRSAARLLGRSEFIVGEFHILGMSISKKSRNLTQ